MAQQRHCVQVVRRRRGQQLAVILALVLAPVFLAMGALGANGPPAPDSPASPASPDSPPLDSSSSGGGGGGAPPDNENLWRQFHVGFMFTSWGVLIPLGILIARYLKPLHESWWFEAHRTFMIGGVLCSIVGYCIGLYKWMPWDTWHGALGTAVFGISLGQVLNGYARPPHVHKADNSGRILNHSKSGPLAMHTDARAHPLLALTRTVWSWFHRLVGVTLFVISFTTMFKGIELYADNDATYSKTLWTGLLAGWLAFLVGVAIAFELLRLKSRGSARAPASSELNSVSVDSKKITVDQEGEP